jgi:hypothetical protein
LTKNKKKVDTGEKHFLGGMIMVESNLRVWGNAFLHTPIKLNLYKESLINTFRGRDYKDLKTVIDCNSTLYLAGIFVLKAAGAIMALAGTIGTAYGTATLNPLITLLSVSLTALGAQISAIGHNILQTTLKGKEKLPSPPSPSPVVVPNNAPEVPIPLFIPAPPPVDGDQSSHRSPVASDNDESSNSIDDLPRPIDSDSPNKVEQSLVKGLSEEPPISDPAGAAAETAITNNTGRKPSPTDSDKSAAINHSGCCGTKVPGKKTKGCSVM